MGLTGVPQGPGLEILLKADSVGTKEAILSSIETIRGIKVIQAGVGHISKSDLLMAETSSRLMIGFNTDILPRVKELAKEHNVEIRLYSVIYNLMDDLKKIVSSLDKKVVNEEEKIIGKARVIAVFPGGRKSVILGCHVEEGSFVAGKRFRVISAPGVVHTGIIESMHIEKETVKQAKEGQQVGLKISGFRRARVDDLVECFQVERSKSPGPWQPRGGVFRY